MIAASTSFASPIGYATNLIARILAWGLTAGSKTIQCMFTPLLSIYASFVIEWHRLQEKGGEGVSVRAIPEQDKFWSWCPAEVNDFHAFWAEVMGPGGYSFLDFLRLGGCLDLVWLIGCSLLLPFMWPMVWAQVARNSVGKYIILLGNKHVLIRPTDLCSAECLTALVASHNSHYH